MRNQLKLTNLYKRYAKTLYFYLLKLSGSPQLAEDLTQETFVRATISLLELPTTYQPHGLIEVGGS
ncbi:RNA polymerase sigma factor [Pseudoneobacillus rhizosphaerae]|uniref:RNA polymerase sigma-70 region 2 domain-containing protein n=1 Tax=Pseudoneobacillus rhizosphaerae TaxID=2880968 RepID=A0A9C7L9S2_9BACI|nr:sigma factor [Pseudoneobacillus rhizosphaerae]CAG9607697.1 hypothetical protein NEOCIP111885_01389 [Pseudoneobacillus rhizosphaerae]